MGLAIVLFLIVLVIGSAGVWFLFSRARPHGAPGAGQPHAAVSAQELSPLAQPYRSLLGEAVTIQREVSNRAQTAPATLRLEIDEMAERMFRLVRRALPRAKHGTQLQDFLLRLTAADAEYEATKNEARLVEEELSGFVESMRRVRGKVYGILSNAASLEADRRLHTDLADALSDVSLLEEAMAETVTESNQLY